MLSFKTINFGPLACLQDKHINMPFQSWELRPIAENHARFTIMAAINEAEIEIKVRRHPKENFKMKLEQAIFNNSKHVWWLVLCFQQYPS